MLFRLAPARAECLVEVSGTTGARERRCRVIPALAGRRLQWAGRAVSALAVRRKASLRRALACPVVHAATLSMGSEADRRDASLRGFRPCLVLESAGLRRGLSAHRRGHRQAAEQPAIPGLRRRHSASRRSRTVERGRNADPAADPATATTTRPARPGTRDEGTALRSIRAAALANGAAGWAR